ncbi:MAG TPA: HD domain-containing protein, partial [Spirochaetota bacterium]|nr:HD domain-containing protein [Spirochaetota bacterium]
MTDFSDAKNIVEYVLNDIHTSKDDFINLLDIQEYDDYTYTHSLNVGVIAMVLGKRMNLSDAVLFNVGMAGFLHDIGKLRIPNEIINKPGKLTDE